MRPLAPTIAPDRRFLQGQDPAAGERQTFTMLCQQPPRKDVHGHVHGQVHVVSLRASFTDDREGTNGM